MAVDASALYCRFGREENLKLDLTMTADDCCPLRCRDTTFVRTPEESKRINDLRTPAIIIAAEGAPGTAGLRAAESSSFRAQPDRVPAGCNDRGIAGIDANRQLEDSC